MRAATQLTKALADEFFTTGRIWLRGFFSTDELNRIAHSCETDGAPGSRPALTNELKSLIGARSRLASHVADLGVDPAPVRLAAFDKSAGGNWSVPWHQDRIIAVAERHEINGYANWLPKDGYWHCEPPFALLQSMLFARIHVDGCGAEQGALEISTPAPTACPIAAQDARAIAEAGLVESCAAEPGDILIANALVLHRSRSMIAGERRRALRVDYAKRNLLAAPLEWSLCAG